MLDGAPLAPTGLIGPNAVTQLLDVLEEDGGAGVATALMHEAGMLRPPELTGLMDETHAMRLHQAVRRRMPGRARDLARIAGARTADYILAHRIPRPAQLLLKLLPPAIAGPILTRAIARHAWTFAGSGKFEVLSLNPITLAIADNPVIRGETADHPICDWHAAVFDRLYGALVSPRLRTRETRCCAMGHPACVFEIA